MTFARIAIAIACIAIVVGGCASPAPTTSPTPPASATPATPADPTPGPTAGDAAVIRRPLPSTAPALPGALPDSSRVAAERRATAPVPGGVSVPPGLLYVCVTDKGGTPQQVGIEFAPSVQSLCERHPEMGPCQYERTACRKTGGRVFDRAGAEITMATEAEYDRKVMRFRFRAN